MATVQEQMNRIKTKDELIKWLVNEYFILSSKYYGKSFDEILENEIKAIESKVDELDKE